MKERTGREQLREGKEKGEGARHDARGKLKAMQMRIIDCG